MLGGAAALSAAGRVEFRLAMTHDRFDIAIVGASFAGLALALALSRSLGPELRLAVADRTDLCQAKPSDADDPRAVAVSASSRHLLQALGLWAALAPEAEPVTRIEITDSDLDAGIRPVLLAWDNTFGGTAGEPAAHIVPLPVLAVALRRAVQAEPEIVLLSGLEAKELASGEFFSRIEAANGAAVTARLIVAADGQRSAVRQAAGIKVVGWPYDQTAIATAVEHPARDHGGIAVQHFLPAGPFAMLPLPGRRTSITWTEAAAEARRIMALDDAQFLDEVDRRFGGKLGPLRLAGGRRAWPLSMQLARSYVGPRLALIGDAAHGVHPIAGQGLNLALRDVAALTEVVADAMRAGLDPGDGIALDRYQCWRRFDAMAATAAFDAINRLFSREARLLRSAREVGLQVVDRLPALKRGLVGEAAGLTGDLPKLLRGELP
jgi:2-octaprenyl-6-methoxyphenol hydroxylase